MNDWSILRSKNTLIRMNVINTLKKESERNIYYRIQTDYTKWKTLSKMSYSKKRVKDPLKKESETLSKKRVSNGELLKTSFKDILFKDRKRDKIEKLKLRRKEMQEEIKEIGPFESKEYLIEGIKEIDKRLKKLGG